MNNNQKVDQSTFDHGTHKEFVEYYAKESLSESTSNRMKGIFNCIKRNLENRGINQKLNIADIGCGVGVMSMMWANDGHKVYGLDVNEELLALARQRSNEAKLDIKFYLGSATNLPWENESMDVCIAPELLEHIVDWKACLTEFARILKPNGVLFISTSNKLCPKQNEFNLPFYSWYPASMKKYFVNLARTTRPDIANYATYPAVNWFSFYKLRREFSKMGMSSFDRFDIMEIDSKPSYQKVIIKLIKHNSVFRLLAHSASPELTMLAIKRSK